MKSKSLLGRPREFDAHAALNAATSVFWKHGYSGATVDAIAAAMNMSKPSIYAAFGPKNSLYRLSLQSFCKELVGAIERCGSSGRSIAEDLIALFESEIDYYCQNDPPRGCLLICTAPAETANCDEVQDLLAGTIRNIDTAFAQLLRDRKREGSLETSTEPRVLAQCLQSVLHTLALRARAGESQRALKKFARAAIPALLGEA